MSDFIEFGLEEIGDGTAAARARKAPNAFRTISEVADELHIPQHVLRFWESKFTQVKPLKRGGGRRYYRPDDIALLRSIANLLYTQGYTIKGVQRLLRETGGKLDGQLSPPLPTDLNDPEEEGEAKQPQFMLEPPVVAVKPPFKTPGKPDDFRSIMTHTLQELELLRGLFVK